MRCCCPYALDAGAAGSHSLVRLPCSKRYITLLPKLGPSLRRALVHSLKFTFFVVAHMVLHEVAAFRPGRGYWPFGRRPPSRGGNDGPRADERAAGGSANVRLSPDFFRSTPNSRHSGQGWECLRLTQSGSRGSPIRDPLHQRLQPFRHLHDCSGCFRLERWPGGTCTHWKSAALPRRTP